MLYASVGKEPAKGGDRLEELELRREVTEYLLRVMRGEEAGTAQSMKAAEMLVKCFGSLQEGSGSQDRPVIIDDVRREEREV